MFSNWLTHLFRKNIITKDDKGHYHSYPKYHGYRGGYADCTICQSCNAVGLYEDCHIVDPCYWCGGKVKGGYPGKFNYETRIWEFKK